MAKNKFNPGDLVRITSKTSQWQDAIGEVVGYCNGTQQNIVKVKISKKLTVNLVDSGVALINNNDSADSPINGTAEKEDLRKKVLEMLDEDQFDGYDDIAKAFFASLDIGRMSFFNIGLYLLEAFLDGDVNAAMIPLCGRSLKDLMEYAGAFDKFERLKLAKAIAHDIVHEGTSNTSSGNWMVYFEEIQEKYKIDLSEDKETLDAIVNELKNSYAEKIAEISVTHDGFDITYYLDFCPNAEE